jgi:hypothetical protein
MKGNEALQNAYIKQREIFEEAQRRRISNRNKQIEDIEKKIASLKTTRDALIQQNEKEREFESLDSFRLKAEEQSKLQKGKKETI